MGMIIYGTRVFTKHQGFFGQREECPNCHRIYKKAYVKNTVWAHLDYIPIFPVKKTYFKMCPICGVGMELKSKQAQMEMQNTYDMTIPNLQIYAVHILAQKPQGIMATDNSYQVWVRDLNTNENVCIASNTTKDMVKQIKKERGLKNLPITDM